LPGNGFEQDLRAPWLVPSKLWLGTLPGTDQVELGPRRESERRCQSPLGCLRAIKGDDDVAGLPPFGQVSFAGL